MDRLPGAGSLLDTSLGTNVGKTMALPTPPSCHWWLMTLRMEEVGWDLCTTLGLVYL